MRNDGLIIANGITLWTLNPHNNALKNDFLENLLVTAFLVCKAITPVIGNRKLRVIRGFESSRYIRYEVDFNPSVDLLRHARGMALELTWESVTDEELMFAANAIFNAAEEPVKIVVDSERKTLYVARGVDTAMISERTANKFRTVKKAA